MQRFVLTTVSLLLGLALALPARAVMYTPRMNEAEWRTELSPFICRLWQPIPYYGDAVFEVRAGGELGFHLAADNNPMRAGKASLIVTAPVWAAERSPVNLGYVPVSENGIRPISLGRRMANRLLKELHAGMAPVFTRRSWYGDDVSIQVALSSVSFRSAYGQYQDCLAQLLPVSWDQISRTRVHFETAKWDITDSAREKLNLIVRYVNADKSVNGFFIDGHTDNVGRSLYNLNLSQKRAEAVMKYLIAKGVDPALITTRYHGEQYPAKPNTSAKNRRYNRRVTIRLERDGV